MTRKSKPLATDPLSPGSGPWGWRNAKAWQSGLPSSCALEIACYTDHPDLTFGFRSDPYVALTPLSTTDILTHYTSGLPRLGVVIRIEQHLPLSDPDSYLPDDWDQDDPIVHHGGDAAQELAALLSLSLGIRLRAGGIMRVFHSSDESPRGHAHEFDSGIPYLPPLPPVGFRILPYTSSNGRTIEFSNARKLFDTYANLPPLEALALVRSARAYQEALWIAESDPRQAWLRLVSAVEAISGLAPDMAAEDALREAHPEMADRVLRTRDPVLIDWVTTKLVHQARSTAKFLSFLKTFEPRAPRQRPAQRYRVDWTTLRKQMDDIYEYRSADLHAGKPFPDPMCRPPSISKRYHIAEEIAWIDRNWSGKAPIHLHMFEYVARSAIQAWWHSAGTQEIGREKPI